MALGITMVYLYHRSQRMHQLLQYTSGLPFWRAPWLALPAGFAQRRKARRGQGDPPRTMRRLMDIYQASGTPPVRNRAHIHMEQLARGLRRIASIPALPSATGPGGLGTARENGIGIADPRDFCRREGPSQAWSGAFLVQESRSLAVRMMRGKAPDPGNNGGRGAAAVPRPRPGGGGPQGGTLRPAHERPPRGRCAGWSPHALFL